MNSSQSMLWKWRNFTDALGDDITGIAVSNNYKSLIVAFMNRSGVVSSNGRSFFVLATGLSYCHYAILLPSGYFMLYTDAGEHIYKINLITKEQTVLLSNVGGSAGTRGLAYDSTNHWLYFSGAQLMRSRPDGTELQNITRHLNLSYDNPGFQIILDDYVDPRNPRIYLAFNGGLYMTNTDGSKEQLIFSSPVEANYTGPYGVTIGIDSNDDKRYIYWSRGRRSKEAILERSVLSDDGCLTTIETIWNQSSTIEASWFYALALVPWKFP
ncbi:unnamed protein product [Rotaria sp. Silwood2]|nr:unnamed protein product [Rotaria sp. Silwood2]CAF3965174.1 unnamed protein product [Rotaria sp. Silwood2]CAF3978870.1 unnamed protein product [Rotaria sp. Silwood2]